MMKGILKIGSIMGIFGLLVACNTDPMGNGFSEMRVHLTDAPCDIDEVNIEVLEVHVRHDDTVTVLTLQNPGIYNLLDFNNGTDTLIANGQVASGRLHEIRLVLGSNNTVVIDSVSYPLTTPSAQQSGLKIKVNDILAPGVVYDYTLDFDACKSVVTTGNGKHLLKPVIRAFVEATTGGIEGVVQPDSAVQYTFVVDNGDTFGTIPNTDGYFRINGISAGTYDVEFVADSGYADYTEVGVPVTAGVVTDLDTIQF